MQNNIQFSVLSNDEMLHINGGNDGESYNDSSFVKDVFYGVGSVIICVYLDAKPADKYQSSLPPNLKK